MFSLIGKGSHVLQDTQTLHSAPSSGPYAALNPHDAGSFSLASIAHNDSGFDFHSVSRSCEEIEGNLRIPESSNMPHLSAKC